MVSAQPHFLLFSGVERPGSSPGRWHFLLESLDGRSVIEAADLEPGVQGERLELLALIRGLEALDQPSRVTLITASRDVSRGIRYGLEEWRANGWCWERDGRWVPVKNFDLWQRVDQALKFHRLECRRWRVDEAESPELAAPAAVPREPAAIRSTATISHAAAPVAGPGVAAMQACWQAVTRAFRAADAGPTWAGA